MNRVTHSVAIMVFFFFILSLNDYYIYNIVIYVVKVKI